MFYCEFCEVFKNTYFEEHLRTTASGLLVTFNFYNVELCNVAALSLNAYNAYTLDLLFVNVYKFINPLLS